MIIPNNHVMRITLSSVSKIVILFTILIALPSLAYSKNPKISDGAVMPITKTGWPKTYQQWGKEWIDRINMLSPKAAENIAQSTECDKVDIVDLSDRSIPKKKVVFFADCANGKRFYVSDDEIKNSTTAISKQAKTAILSDQAAKTACIDSVKNTLNHPSTFNLSSLSTNIYRAPTGNVAVDFSFSAKNSFGLETKNHARCVFDDRGMSPPEIYEEK